MQGKVPKQQEFEEDVYWIALARDLIYTFRHRQEEGYGIADLLRPYLRRHVFSAMDLRDPGPIIRRCRNLSKNANRKRCSVVMEAKGEHQQTGEAEDERGCNSDRRRALAGG
jgi:hypothetical protein